MSYEAIPNTVTTIMKPVRNIKITNNGYLVSEQELIQAAVIHITRNINTNTADMKAMADITYAGNIYNSPNPNIVPPNLMKNFRLSANR